MATYTFLASELYPRFPTAASDLPSRPSLPLELGLGRVEGLVDGLLLLADALDGRGRVLQTSARRKPDLAGKLTLDWSIDMLYACM